MPRRVIAVVDGEPCLSDYVGILLGMAGYDAEEHPDGQSFLDNHHPAVSGLIVNLCLPQPGGREFLCRVQERGMGLPILSISTTVDPGEEELLSLGVAALLIVPFKHDEFFAAVARVLGPPN